MRTITAFFFTVVALATQTLGNPPNANPVADFSSRRGLNGSDQISRIEADVNGNGRLDILLCYVDPNPDIEDRRVAATGDKRLSWTPYMKNADGTYSLPTGVEEDGELIAVPNVAFDPQEVFLGQVSEIGRFALVAREKQTPRRAEALSIIWAFTWENDHFKRQKLGEFATGEQNALFSKYLADDKRTVLQVQQVTP